MWVNRKYNKEITDEMIEDYQNVFSTDAGVRVVTHILSQLCFFKEAETEEERILSNFAKRFLNSFGVWQDGEALQITKNILRSDKWPKKHS